MLPLARLLRPHLPGLKRVYGLRFRSFVPLDAIRRVLHDNGADPIVRAELLADLCRLITLEPKKVLIAKGAPAATLAKMGAGEVSAGAITPSITPLAIEE